MPSDLRVLVDIRPRLLADAVAVAVRACGVEVEVASEEVVVHDDSAYDLVVITAGVRAAHPARLTTRVEPESAAGMDVLLDLITWMTTRSQALSS